MLLKRKKQIIIPFGVPLSDEGDGRVLDDRKR
jgi:hypothetical protein